MNAGLGHRGREAISPPAQDHRHTALGPQGDMLHRHGHMVFLKFKGKRSHDMGKDDRRLLQREGSADADARTGAEGQIGKSIDFFARTGKKPARIEAIRFFPKRAMAVVSCPAPIKVRILALTSVSLNPAPVCGSCASRRRVRISRGATALPLARRRLRLTMSASTTEAKKASAERLPSLVKRGSHSGKSRRSKGSSWPTVAK